MTPCSTMRDKLAREVELPFPIFLYHAVSAVHLSASHDSLSDASPAGDSTLAIGALERRRRPPLIDWADLKRR